MNRILIDNYRFINKWLPLLIAILLATGYLYTQPGIWDINTFNNDNRISLPGFFHLDKEYRHLGDDTLSFSMKVSSPLGYRLIFYFLSNFVSILVIPKIIQVVCFLLYLLFGYKVGKSVLGRWGGVISIFYMITGTYIMSIIGGGNPRAFSPALYMALIYFLITRNHKGILLNALMGTLFYPQAMIISIFAFFIMDINELYKLGFKKFFHKYSQKYILFIFTILLIFTILIPFNVNQNRRFGELYSFKEAKSHESWHESGRLGKRIPIQNFLSDIGKTIGLFKRIEVYPFYHISKKIDYGHLKRWIKDKGYLRALNDYWQLKLTGYWVKIGNWNRERGHIVILMLYVIVPMVISIYGLFKVPQAVIFFCLSVLIAYTLSSVFAFKFYRPDKYLIYPIGVFLSQYIIIGVGHSYKYGKDKINRGTLIVLSFLIIEFIFYGTGINKNSSLHTYIKPHQAGLFSYILTSVKKDEMIAGKLKDMDSIPLLAKRKVLISHETAFPWWKRYNEVIVIPRANIVAKAYFADSKELFNELRSKFDVDYFLVDKRDFKNKEYPEDFIISPYDKTARKAFSKNRDRYYLNSEYVEGVVYEDDHYRFIDLNKMFLKN